MSMLARGCSTWAIVAAFVLHLPAGAGPVGGIGRSPCGLWTGLDAIPADKAALDGWIRPTNFRAVALDVDALKNTLAVAPLEFTAAAANAPVEITLPTPDGSWSRFRVVLSPVMEPGLAEKFPEIKTYFGVGVDDPWATVRMEWTYLGFGAQILSANGSWYIDRYSRGDQTLYTAYRRADLRRGVDDFWTCSTPGAGPQDWINDVPRDAARNFGTQLRTFRIAIGATGEYTTAVSAPSAPTVALGLSAVTTTVNRVTQVYERDLATRLLLVSNNNLTIYTNSATDPYTNGNSNTMLNQNVTALNGQIGSANYDVGHAFGTGSGGVAGAIGNVCTANKAQGVSLRNQPTGDPFDIDYVAHELGHQFAGRHNFNNCSTGPGDSANVAWEPGSGSSIMGYAGICSAATNLQSNSDAMFHAGNIGDQMSPYIASGTGAGACDQLLNTGNSVPTITVPPSGRTIPVRTPFELTASGSDANGDALTYSWEQMNTGSAIALNTSGGPMLDYTGTFPGTSFPTFFRPFLPVTSPTRTFPRLATVLNGFATNTNYVRGEGVPTTTRTGSNALRFRGIVRDGRGGVIWSDVTINVTDTAGPFAVTAPNGGESLTSGQPFTVTWNVANTTAAPVSTSQVNIRLSTDGGNTFPTLLASGVPNSGSASVVIPGPATTTARVRVEAVGNFFFDVSNSNFSITGVQPPGAFSLLSPANGAAGVPLTPTLSWGSSSGASGYTLELDSDAGFAPPLIIQQALSAGVTSYAVPAGTLAQNTPYFWRVVATGPGGTTSSSPASASFTTLAPPPPPPAFGLLAPADGVTVTTLTPTLQWLLSSGAAGYTVEVDTDAGFAPPLTLFSSLAGDTSTVFTIPPGTLSVSTTYFWRVIASGPGGTTLSTPASRSFTTFTPCPGDIDGNGSVGANDLSSLLSSFGSCPGNPNYLPAANLDSNPCIGANDLSTLLANYGCSS
ncbi:MAG: hypothetical protein IBJ11_00120 [Phycisphaerales bacterium]|nr:hypothetical protein [Phycisphaerales bacterium]